MIEDLRFVPLETESYRYAPETQLPETSWAKHRVKTQREQCAEKEQNKLMAQRKRDFARLKRLMRKRWRITLSVRPYVPGEKHTIPLNFRTEQEAWLYGRCMPIFDLKIPGKHKIVSYSVESFYLPEGTTP